MEWVLLAAAIAKGASSLWNRYVTDQETRKELNKQKDRLSQAITDTNTLYKQKASNMKNSVQRENSLLSDRISITELNRDNAAYTAGTTLAKQTDVQLAELATQKVEASMATGQAEQAVADSGFRGTGSASNNVFNVEQAAHYNEQAAIAQINLQRFSNFEQAKANYTSATQQADMYRKQIEMNDAALKDELALLELNRQADEQDLKWKLEDVTYQRKYMDSGEYWTTQVLGYATDLLGIAGDAGEAFGWGSGGGGGKNIGTPTRDYRKDSYATRKGSRSAR